MWLSLRKIGRGFFIGISARIAGLHQLFVTSTSVNAEYSSWCFGFRAGHLARLDLITIAIPARLS